MNGRLPPHDLDAERSCLGAMMLSIDAARDVLAILVPGDFYDPKHQLVFATMVALRADGISLDVVTVASELKAHDPSTEWLQLLLEAQNACPSISTAGRYAELVAQAASLRHIIMLAADMTEQAFGRAEPGEIIDRAKGRLSETSLRASADGPYEKLTTFTQFVRDVGSKPVDWVVPGVLGRGERLLIVAPEGAGKGVLIRQLAIAVGGGVHPFTQAPLPSQPTLYLDLENPARTIAHQAQLSLQGARRLLQEPDQSWILHEEAGLDLRTSAAQVYLEKALQVIRPVMLCIGPIYKAARKKSSEQWEDATLDLFCFLDDIRVRYDCALVMEHHAPKGAGTRELVPFGSSAWLRWPDYGYRLEPAEVDRQGNPTRLIVGTFRGNRMASAWPDEFVRGGSENLPWVSRNRPR